MNKKRVVKTIGVFVLLIFVLLEGNHFLHAEEAMDENQPDQETLDESSEETQNLQTITVEIHEAQNQPIEDLSVIVDGEPYTVASHDFEDNVLSMQVDPAHTEMIELRSAHYQFEPAFLSLDMANIQENYQIQAFNQDDQDVMDGAVIYGKDGIQKDAYDNDETVTVSVAAKNPNHLLYYQIADGEWQLSDSDMFEVHAMSKEAHEVLVAYYIQYADSPDQRPDEDGFIEPVDPVRLTIQFLAVENNSNDPEQSGESNGNDLSFKDDEGNVYTKDEINCTVAEMESDDSAKYQRVIGYYDEFKGLNVNHITYYQAGLYAQDQRVQPNGTYELVLPFPQNATIQNEFVIMQFKDGNTDHGSVLSYTLAEDGIHVQVDHVSVFVVGWKDKQNMGASDKENEIDPTIPINQNVNNVNSATTGGVNTGDIFSLNIWIILAIASCFSLSIILRKKLHKQGNV